MEQVLNAEGVAVVLLGAKLTSLHSAVSIFHVGNCDLICMCLVALTLKRDWTMGMMSRCRFQGEWESYGAHYEEVRLYCLRLSLT